MTCIAFCFTIKRLPKILGVAYCFTQILDMDYSAVQKTVWWREIMSAKVRIIFHLMIRVNIGNPICPDLIWGRNRALCCQNALGGRSFEIFCVLPLTDVTISYGITQSDGISPGSIFFCWTVINLGIIRPSFNILISKSFIRPITTCHFWSGFCQSTRHCRKPFLMIIRIKNN